MSYQPPAHRPPPPPRPPQAHTQAPHAQHPHAQHAPHAQYPQHPQLAHGQTPRAPYSPPAPTLPPSEHEPHAPAPAEARKLAALAYLALVPPLWPVAPLVWALKGKEHPLVRWHAARSTLLVGALFLFASTVAPVLYVLVTYVGIFLMLMLGDRETLRLMPLVSVGALVIPSTVVQIALLAHAPFAASMARRGDVVREGLVARGTAWLVKSKPFD